MFIKYLLSARHLGKHFKCIISFNELGNRCYYIIPIFQMRD